MNPLKVLTIYQPWASFLAEGYKHYETRGHAVSFRGPLAIHAGKTTRYVPFELHPKHNPPGVPLGAIIAVGWLNAMVKAEDFFNLSEQERELGDWRPGRWGWQIINIQRLEVPIPISGKQGLWTPPDLIYDVLPNIKGPAGDLWTPRGNRLPTEEVDDGA